MPIPCESAFFYGNHRMNHTIRQLRASDAAELRAIRLEALQTYPLNYTGTYAAEAQHDVAWFAEMLKTELVFGAWDENGTLFATACLSPDTRPRNEHKATLRMVYVRPSHQGGGVARALLRETLRYGARHFEQIILSVEAENHRAIWLYESLGFIIYGHEPRASKIAETHYLDDLLMVMFTEELNV
jgi:ribosomal protein S18 acetylase RimI-like enzyme